MRLAERYQLVAIHVAGLDLNALRITRGCEPTRLREMRLENRK